MEKSKKQFSSGNVTQNEEGILINGNCSKDANIMIPAVEKEVVSVERVLKQMEMIHDLYQQAMKKDQHYGKIPGTEKDTLFKAGAEKLNLMFRLVPRVDEEKITNFDNGHREIQYIIGLYKIGSGEFMGHGIGSCSTLESKFRYRWMNTTRKPAKEDAEKIKAQGLGKWRKYNDNWIWQERTENPDIADIYNTVKKMAFKRALVSATINATGVSDIFTQDIEDMPEMISEEINSNTETKQENIDELYAECSRKLSSAPNLEILAKIAKEYQLVKFTKDQRSNLERQYDIRKNEMLEAIK